jgi:hypothetical protein
MNEQDLDVSDPEDAALLDELRQSLAAADPVPPHVLHAARETLTWRTIDAELAELAELAYDSLTDDKVLAGVRGVMEQRLLTFNAADVTVELEVDRDGDHRTVLGQVVPPSPGHVDLTHSDGELIVPVDEVGRFSIANVPAGPVRLGCTLDDGRRALLPWMIL